MTIILSSGNAKKIKELQSILSGFFVCGYREFIDEVEIIEDGKSFEENALLKADEMFERLKDKMEGKGDFLILSDDSGLSVEALGGMPEIYSARFANIDVGDLGDGGLERLCERNFEIPKKSASDEENNLCLLECLSHLGLRESKASFICVIAVRGRMGGIEVRETFRGECGGKVIKAPLNPQSFGYDPLFVPDGYSITMDKIVEKDRISHRFKALQKFREFLGERFAKI